MVLLSIPLLSINNRAITENPSMLISTTGHIVHQNSLSFYLLSKLGAEWIDKNSLILVKNKEKSKFIPLWVDCEFLNSIRCRSNIGYDNLFFIFLQFFSRLLWLNFKLTSFTAKIFYQNHGQD